MEAISVARYFIYLANNKSNYSITPLKLQKLLYYAQGFSYLWDGEKLFVDEMEAWQYGPVIRSVYDEFKKYGQSKLPASEGKNFEIKEESKETIEAVWKGFKDYSASELVDMTHAEDPWLNCINNNDDVIKKEDIKRYFEKAY